MTHGLRWFCLLLYLVVAVTGEAAIVRIDNPQASPVIDKANVLSADQITSLSTRLRGLAATDGTQVAVLVVPTTGEEDMFTFAQRTATEWGIGQKNQNNGALFAIAIDDRQSRIQVGYGLEGRLTDALSKRILSTEVSPRFREGDYYAGISRGVDSIIAVVRGEYQAPPVQEEGAGDVVFYLVVFGLVFLFIWLSVRNRGGGSGGRGGRRGPGVVMLPNVWTTGGHSSGGWGHSGGDSGGFSGGFGGGSFGGGGAGDSW